MYVRPKMVFWVYLINVRTPKIGFSGVLKTIFYRIFPHKTVSPFPFTNAFAQADISSGEPVFIEPPRYFKSYGGRGDVVLGLKKSCIFKPKPHAYGMKNCKMVC